MAEGFSHIGLTTRDMAATIEFYESTLGFERIADSRIEIAEGGELHQVVFDVGNDQFLAVVEPHDVPGVPEDYDTGINRGLGLPNLFYHFAFRVQDIEHLRRLRDQLTAQGLRVSDLVDHDVGISIYLRDPNDAQLEFTTPTRGFGDEDLHNSRAVARASLG